MNINIHILYLIVSVFVGFYFIYINAPKPKYIIKYPNNDNIDNTIYVDDNGVCYKYTINEEKCPI